MVTVTAEKAFVVLEVLWELENALWELFYEEFLTICEIKSEELSHKETV
jgi:hypothetical protein